MALLVGLVAGGGREVRAAGPVTVFLNHQGGSYTRGRPNDSRTNVTSVPPAGIDSFTLPAWDVPADEWAGVVSCVQELFAPFNLNVVDQDPGSSPHVEAVIGGDPITLGLDGSVGGVSPFLSDCSTIDNSIVFIFPSSIGSDDRRVCETIAQEVAHSFGLDHQYLCQDPMTYLTGCGDKTFLFRDSVCGEYEPRDCKCSQTQNSARMLLDRVGRSDQPALWLSRPFSGSEVGLDFPVTAAFTHAPAALDLYVDGLLADSATPVESSQPYQVVDLYPPATLRPGTHQVRLVARFDSTSQTETELIDVDTSPNVGVDGGCAAGGGGGGAGAWLVLMAVVLAGGRRRRRVGRRRGRGPLAAVALAAAAVLTGGCTTLVPGGPHPDNGMAVNCAPAPDLGPAVAVVWTPSNGPCTGTLIGPHTLVTAAHCVAGAVEAGDPVITVIDGRQYVAGGPVYHPDYAPGQGGAPATNDLALVFTTEAVEGVSPVVLSGQAPAAGEGLTVVGFGDWAPNQAADPYREGGDGTVTDSDGLSFRYDNGGGDASCLAGLGGGPVLDAGSSDQWLGLGGEQNQVMRLDQYACWIACTGGADVAPTALPGGCDCTQAQLRACNQCGAEFLDTTSQTWTACQPDEADFPCDAGLTCDATGACVPAA